MAELSRKKKFCFSLFATLFFYLIFELVISTFLYAKNLFSPPVDLWFLENSGKTVQFDPIRGYKLTSLPSRFAKVSFGKVEYVGTFRGNSQGFPDRDDFFPPHGDSKKTRIAVFGDSFSAAQYLQKNWLDQVEDAARQKSIPLELLNFSVDGAGLANWWSILTRLVQPEHYQIDGILFAVYPGDLRRTFSIAEHRGYQHHMFARVPSWDPNQWPKTLDQARLYLKQRGGYILSSENFEKALQGKWRPDTKPYWRPFIATESGILAKETFVIVKKWIKKWFHISTPSFSSFEPERRELIEQISRFSETNNLPVFVVRIPSQQELLEKSPPPDDVVHFAKMLNANLIDGSEAFVGLDKKEIQAQFFKYDGHWNQSGSDRFAAFIFRIFNTSACWDQSLGPRR